MSNEITIGGNVFCVCPLAGERSFLLQIKILPAMAEVAALYALFVSTVVEISDGGKRADLNVMEVLPEALPALEKASPIIARLCAKLPPEDLKEITRALLEGATMNGQMLYSSQGNPIDILMRGRTLDMWRLIVHAMGVSYPDFFGLLRGLRAPSGAAGGSAESSMSVPGPAGGSS